MKKQNIGILGMGIVATGFCQTYFLNQGEIDKKMGTTFEFKKVLVKNKDKKRISELPQSIYVDDFDQFDLKELDIVVELMGGVSPACEYIKKALEAGCHVVTANKELMAKKGKELIQIAHKNNVLLRYEASVGGGIPLIGTINDSLTSNKIVKLMGILNGTTNYILTKMTKEKIEFDAALKRAQTLGFAESNPTADVDGFDAAYKLAILSKDAFGVIPDPEEISKQGIRNISIEDIEYGLELGYKIKLLAIGERSNAHVELSVQPTFIPIDHPIASVNNEYNALYIEGNSVGEIMLYGKGAGAMPTGSAVLSDVVDIVVKKSDYIGSCMAQNIVVKNIGFSAYYVRMEVLDLPGVLGQIAVAFGDYGISLDSVVQRARGGQFAPLVFITHDVERMKLNDALRTIASKEYVNEIQSIIKVVK
ncbi:MAG: homoserine dehydrogenase [Clostridiales bacterium]|nr:homoserine dehydrogenase [Clostridiales bacterium]